MARLADHSSPIEVWLSQPSIQVTCNVAHEDGTSEEVLVESLSLRGAKREVTRRLTVQGYRPVGRWVEWEETGVDQAAVRRLFKFDESRSAG